MQRFLIGIDLLSTWVGKIFSWCILLLTLVVTYRMKTSYVTTRVSSKIFSWCILLLTLVVTYEVFMRYVLSQPTAWAYDTSYILYGSLFLMCGPYLLSRNGHVRGDFLYRFWSPRSQAISDLALHIIFFFPGILALVYSGYWFAEMSWRMNEHSSFTPDGPPIYPFKALIPIVGVLLVIQGLAECARCVVAIRTNVWPQRLHDVVELEELMLKQHAAEDEADRFAHEHAEQGGGVR